MTVLTLVLALLAAQTVALPSDPSVPVVVRCPVHKTTRIVLPEPLHQFKGAPDDKARLGVEIERRKPRATLLVRPSEHPFRGQLEFRGPSLTVRLVIETLANGRDTEIRLAPHPAGPRVAPPPIPTATPTPTATAEPTPAPVAVQTPEPTPTPAPVLPTPAPSATPALVAAASPAPTPAFEAVPASELVWARLIPIDRREGLPGQAPMILVDALSGRESVWFRFRLEGGAGSRVSAVTWENGEITSFEQYAEGKDRRIGVRLPKSRVTPRTRIALVVEGGPTYRFTLSAPTLSNVLKSLFQ